MQRDLFLLHAALVAENDRHAGIEEGKLAQAMLQRGVIELDLGEGLGGRQEGDFRAALGFAVDERRVADDDERRFRLAIAEAHVMLFAVAPDAQVEPFRQRVDDRHADAVQPAGDLVGALLEFPAGMKLGHDDFGGGHAFFGVDAGWDAAAVVAHRRGAVRVQDHVDAVGMAGQCLVDGVVDDLMHHVMQAEPSSVSPIYMPGRLRTASRPRSTLMLSAP